MKFIDAYLGTASQIAQVSEKILRDVFGKTNLKINIEFCPQ